MQDKGKLVFNQSKEITPVLVKVQRDSYLVHSQYHGDYCSPFWKAAWQITAKIEKYVLLLKNLEFLQN